MESKRRLRFVFLTVAPGFLLTCLFMLYPAGKMLRLSLYQASAMLRNPKFVGLDNFKELLTDENYFVSLKNTLIMIGFGTFIILSVAILLAVIVTQSNIIGKGALRVIFFFPSIMSIILIGIVWVFIYHPNIGIINVFLENIGLGSLKQPWLGSSKYALSSIMITLVWQAAGYFMVMYVAGIDRIPKVLYEAASIDGAGKLRQFFVITFPFLWDVVRMTIIFAIGATINVGFILTTIMTSGGPGMSTTVMLGYMYSQAFGNSNFGYAMAIATTILVISLGLSFISNLVTKKETIEM